jgi:hypothetical protein
MNDEPIRPPCGTKACSLVLVGLDYPEGVASEYQCMTCNRIWLVYMSQLGAHWQHIATLHHVKE